MKKGVLQNCVMILITFFLISGHVFRGPTSRIVWYLPIGTRVGTFLTGIVLSIVFDYFFNTFWCPNPFKMRLRGSKIRKKCSQSVPKDIHGTQKGIHGTPNVPRGSHLMEIMRNAKVFHTLWHQPPPVNLIKRGTGKHLSFRMLFRIE